jgi:hypothetical protein
MLSLAQSAVCQAQLRPSARLSSRPAAYPNYSQLLKISWHFQYRMTVEFQLRDFLGFPAIPNLADQLHAPASRSINHLGFF